MTVKDSRLQTDRRPSDLSVPPRPARPQANALKEGTPEEFMASPEDLENLKHREWQLYYTIKPQNYYHSWMVQQAAITTMRIERCGRIERRLRDQIAAKAEFFWDDDRRIDAEALGRELADDPVSGVIKLQRTPHGCEWMMNRWAWLAHTADTQSVWTDAQRSLAFDLLGEPADSRNGDPGQAIDLDGRSVEGSAKLADLARQEVARLLARRDQIAGIDATDRALACSDLAETPLPEVARLRRYESALLKRFKYFIEQTKFVSTYLRPHPDVSPADLADPAAAPEATFVTQAPAGPSTKAEDQEILRDSDPLYPLLDERDDPDDLASKKGKNKAYALANRETRRRERQRRRA